ncbi:MAG TPA: asparagine synthase-related protein [Thermoanaerobaculia bacterium]|nr:asparagine synthase-related protein [Thermoanaerobaculia bacterium]
MSAPRRFEQLLAGGGGLDAVSALQYIDMETYLPDDILAKVDWTSMAISLESRVLLLDHRLLEFVATIPSSLKLVGGAGKHILKGAMSSRLAADILTRRKMGFGVPLGAWFRNELHDMTHDLLLDPRTRQRGIFRPSWVEGLLRTHDSARRDCSARLWAMLCLELWMRRWIDGSPSPVARAA